MKRQLPEWMYYNTTPLPCPFCGCAPWGVFGEPGEIVIECETEDCGTWKTDADTKDEAIVRWNRRTTVHAQGNYTERK